jgi:hypothetical protein
MFLDQIIGSAEFLEGCGSDRRKRVDERVYSELCRGKQPRKKSRRDQEKEKASVPLDCREED